MIKTTVVCDECGTQKGEETNWFAVTDFTDEFKVSRTGMYTGSLPPGTKDICGQNCLHKQLDKFLSKTVATAETSAKDGIVTHGFVE